MRVLGWSPVVPSRFGNRYAYGVVREGRRTLVVSGGLGLSLVPVRLGVPPELTVVRVGGGEGGAGVATSWRGRGADGAQGRPA